MFASELLAQCSRKMFRLEEAPEPGEKRNVPLDRPWALALRLAGELESFDEVCKFQKTAVHSVLLTYNQGDIPLKVRV